MSVIRRPVLVTDDADVRDDVLRLAVAAGVDVDVLRATDLARRRWLSAPLVMVGPDGARALADAGLPPRHGIVVVCRGGPPPSLWPSAVECGAERVFTLPDAEGALVDHLADAVEGPGQPAQVVAMVGGRGGAGATVLAVGLAVMAARTGRLVTLADLDPLGGGVDLALGAEDLPGLRWGDLAATSGRLSGAALRDSLPSAHGVAVLSFGRTCPPEVPVSAVRSVLTAARRMGGLVVIDLPRQLGPAAVEALRLADVTLLVVPPEVRAVAAAVRLCAVLRAAAQDIRLVVRRPSTGGLAGVQIATTLRLPLAGEVRSETGLVVDLERGVPPAERGRGPLAALCRDLLNALPRAREVAA